MKPETPAWEAMGLRQVDLLPQPPGSIGPPLWPKSALSYRWEPGGSGSRTCPSHQACPSPIEMLTEAARP